MFIHDLWLQDNIFVILTLQILKQNFIYINLSSKKKDTFFIVAMYKCFLKIYIVRAIQKKFAYTEFKL